MIHPRSTVFGVVLLTVSTLAAGLQAQEFAPAVVFDMGGKFDKSFNESAYDGVKRLKQEANIVALEFEIANEAQREQALRRFAKRGADPVIVVGFTQAGALAKVAPEFP
jgi:basic membrane protein A